jgi:hypothetical protein
VRKSFLVFLPTFLATGPGPSTNTYVNGEKSVTFDEDQLRPEMRPFSSHYDVSDSSALTVSGEREFLKHVLEGSSVHLIPAGIRRNHHLVGVLQVPHQIVQVPELRIAVAPIIFHPQAYEVCGWLVGMIFPDVSVQIMLRTLPLEQLRTFFAPD